MSDEERTYKIKYEALLHEYERLRLELEASRAANERSCCSYQRKLGREYERAQATRDAVLRARESIEICLSGIEEALKEDDWRDD